MAKKENSLANVLSKYNAEKPTDLIPTGIISVDAILGGGIAPGATYCFWGPPGSFKTTVAVQIMRSVLKRGEKAVFIDVEKAFNANQQEAFGVREFVEDGMCIHLTADTYAQADEICMAIAQDPEDIKLVLVDSETQLLPKIGEDAAVDSNQPGVKARQGSVWLTKTKSAFYNAGVTMIILAHARANLNMQSMYGPTTKMAGGYATAHVPDAILQFLPGQKFGPKETPEGVIIHLSTDKNKFAKPFQRIDTKCFYGVGIKKKVEIIEFAIQQGLIEQKGSFFNLPNGDTVRGREALNELSNEQLKSIKEALNPIIE